MTTKPLEAWPMKLKMLAFKYADASYLVSEENHPEQEAEDALQNLVSYVESLLALSKQETLSEVRGIVEGMKKSLPKTKCINAENHLFGSCFQCEKIKGYNQALTDLLAFLEARKG